MASTANKETLNGGAGKEGKVEVREEEGGKGGHGARKGETGYEIVIVPRAREIHQGLLTTPWSCLRCLLTCTRLLLRLQKVPGVPDLVLTNGPATALIVLLAVQVVRIWNEIIHLFPWHKGGRGMKEGDRRGVEKRGGLKTMYIESWARVRTPSLTLKLVYWLRLGDRVIVQHRGLAERGWGEWRGDLMR